MVQLNAEVANLLTRALQLKFRRKIIMERIKLIKALVPKSVVLNIRKLPPYNTDKIGTGWPSGVKLTLKSSDHLNCFRKLRP